MNKNLFVFLWFPINIRNVYQNNEIFPPDDINNKVFSFIHSNPIYFSLSVVSLDFKSPSSAFSAFFRFGFPPPPLSHYSHVFFFPAPSIDDRRRRARRSNNWIMTKYLTIPHKRRYQYTREGRELVTAGFLLNVRSYTAPQRQQQQQQTNQRNPAR